MDLLARAAEVKLRGFKTEENDDDFLQYHGGHHHGPEPELVLKEGEDPKLAKKRRDLETYKKAMKKLRCVSFVSVFFIVC